MPETPRNTDAASSSDEPREIDLGARSFAGENVAEDQRHQARDRGAGLGAGSTENREARYPDGLEGERPEDDLD